MRSIIGTYECRLDAKGRVMIPAALKKQLPEMERGFVLKRAIFDSCIELWPMEEWDREMVKINGLNKYKQENKVFIRKFMAGVKQVEIDDAGRLLIAKDLIEYSNMSKEIVFTSQGNIIELWDKANYEAKMSEDIDFADLAEKVMGSIDL